jgi:hypothetical protein
VGPDTHHSVYEPLYVFINKNKWNNLAAACPPQDWGEWIQNGGLACETIEGDNKLINFRFSEEAPQPPFIDWDCSDYHPVKIEYDREDPSEHSDQTLLLQLTSRSQCQGFLRDYTIPISIRNVNQNYRIFEPGDNEYNRQWFIIDRMAKLLSLDSNGTMEHPEIKLYCKKDYVVEVDGGTSWDPAEYPNPLEFLQATYDYDVYPLHESATYLTTPYSIVSEGINVSQNVKTHAFAINTMGNSLQALQGRVQHVEDEVSVVGIQLNSVKEQVDDISRCIKPNEGMQALSIVADLIAFIPEVGAIGQLAYDLGATFYESTTVPSARRSNDYSITTNSNNGSSRTRGEYDVDSNFIHCSVRLRAMLRRLC